MVVAVTKGMHDVEKGLLQLGYEVVEYGRYTMPIDAVVYYGSHLDSAQMTRSNFGGNTGILMINATNKSIQDIDNCLKRRTYTPLF